MYVVASKCIKFSLGVNINNKVNTLSNGQLLIQLAQTGLPNNKKSILCFHQPDRFSTVHSPGGVS